MTDDRWLPPRAPATEPTAVPEGVPSDDRPRREGLLGKLAAPFAALIAFLSKIKVVLLALAKVKFLATAGSMLVSIVAYASLWGWKFGVGFVLLLLVHEYGHVIQLRREGVKDASAPIFIPFMGALIWSKSLGGDAAAEARVGLAGPVLGSIGAALCVVVYALTGEEFWRALAFTGFFLNLFNLLPVGFLDGARAAAALSPWVWLLGVFGMVVLVLTVPNPIIILIAVLAIWETYRRFKQFRSGDPAVKTYYSIAKRDRILIGATYLVLIVALVIAMDATHLERSL
ncbi:MAG TPA: site-2 protease family protein [Baekduia sp.]|uniref:site-2 protease family protein n=1 Tax=Baekduia sp. TaxID=2600305 RepID=UPI002D79EA55|nr:site-2 protease family protein [Baekduia sp.]HET6506753.1 site-2 protease family protein [Baekduia sp.]